jgi:type III restriction enzyme
MSVQFRIHEQVLRVVDARDEVEASVRKYDAFLNLLCAGKYAFQQDAVRTTLRFLLSDKYPDLERLAIENWEASASIRARHESREAFLARMPLRDRKAASIDLATGTGKSYAMYALATIALAEGLVDRVLVLCPSLTIEDALLDKFETFIGTPDFADMLREVGAKVAIPGLKRGTETIQPGDICIENIHAVYENTGSSIADSFRGNGARTLVLNDEAHHLFSPAGDEAAAMKKWLKFLLNPEFGFRYAINVTGTAYTDNEYFPDVIARFGLKQAIEQGVVKKPDYVLERTTKANSWQETYQFHAANAAEYGKVLKPVTIVVTADIASCVEAWNELVKFLITREKLSRPEAEAKTIWVASGIPSNAAAKARIEKILPKSSKEDSPEKRRLRNLALLKEVDQPGNKVEWIVSVSMLTEGWDVKNVFQIVPHESRAFNSKLLIAQVLGRGLRVPPGLPKLPMVKVTNHERWSEDIGRLLQEVLEVENTLSWGYTPERKAFIFPLHNLRYEPQQTTTETKRERAREPDVTFKPQARRTTEYTTFKETGRQAVNIEHVDTLDIGDAVRSVRLFLRAKDENLAAKWTAARLRKFIATKLEQAGQDAAFLSRENYLLLQQAFGPMFRNVDQQSPRFSQKAGDLFAVDLAAVSAQSFSESALKAHGNVWYAQEAPPAYAGPELELWKQYQTFMKQYAEYGHDASEQAQAVAPRIHQVDLRRFKTPWNLQYTSHEPERQFGELLFDHANLFDAFVKMPDRGAYSFPYSYKPSKTGKSHTANENFNPDFFLKMAGATEILVIEIKQDGDDDNRNRAKYRDGLRHFANLNAKLEAAGEPWRYHFKFLSPADYTHFFAAVKSGNYASWKSSLMQELGKP